MTLQRLRRLQPLVQPWIFLPIICVILTGTCGLSACTTVYDAFQVVPKHDATLVACKSFKAIPWDPKDTDGTIKEVKQHNAAYDALCAPAVPEKKQAILRQPKQEAIAGLVQE